jgi:hypothetical protein
MLAGVEQIAPAKEAPPMKSTCDDKIVFRS